MAHDKTDGHQSNARKHDAKANAEEYAPRSGMKNQPSLSEVPDFEKCLSDGRHELEFVTDNDLDSRQSVSSSDNSDNSGSSSGSETNSAYYDISSSSSENTDDDSDGSTDRYIISYRTMTLIMHMLKSNEIQMAQRNPDIISRA